MADVEFEEGTGYLVENGDTKGQAIISIAVSLKRIADAMGGDNKRYGFADVLDAIHRDIVK